MDAIWISLLPYGQLPLSKNEMDLDIFAITSVTSYYSFLKSFYGLAGIPTIFQQKIVQTLENKHPAWLDGILVVYQTKPNKLKLKVNRPPLSAPNGEIQKDLIGPIWIDLSRRVDLTYYSPWTRIVNGQPPVCKNYWRTNAGNNPTKWNNSFMWNT